MNGLELDTNYYLKVAIDDITLPAGDKEVNLIVVY